MVTLMCRKMRKDERKEWDGRKLRKGRGKIDRNKGTNLHHPIRYE
jgi:hypothetical protein